MINLTWKSALTIVLVGLVACAGESAAPEPEAEPTEVVERPEFEDVLWRLVEYRGETGETLPVLEGTTVEVFFVFGAGPS